MHKTIALFSTLFLLLAAPRMTIGKLTDIDLYATGDALITFDTETGLEWLDVAQTQGWSYEDVSTSAFVSQGGWRHALGQEVESLFTRYIGGSNGCSFFNNQEVYNKARQVQSKLGVNWSDGERKTHDFLKHEGGLPYGDGFLGTISDGYQTRWFVREFQSWDVNHREPNLGHFLVRLHGGSFCVSTSEELQAALTAAASNGQDDVIQVVQGTYLGNFRYSSNENSNITIGGGYTVNCMERQVDSINTVLDAQQSGGVLWVTTQGGGKVNISGLTLQHGQLSGGIYIETDGDIIINDNIITTNSGQSIGGVAALAGASGSVSIANNIILSNLNDGQGGGVRTWARYGTISLCGNTIINNLATYGVGGGVWAQSFYGTVTLSNNLIANNSGDGVFACTISGHINPVNNTIIGNSHGLLVDLNEPKGFVGVTEANIYNNVIYNNSDFDLIIKNKNADGWASRVNLHNNNFDWNATFFELRIDIPASNLNNEDPLFIDPDKRDYHLQLGSPCIDTGNNAAPDLPLTDIEGKERIWDGTGSGTAIVDMGAYEYLSEIVNNVLWIRGFDRLVSLWKTNEEDLFFEERLYGPFSGWVVRSHHKCSGGTAKILWQRQSDGLVSLWSIDHSGKFISEKLYGPFTGWEVKDYHRISDGTGRILWQRTADGLVSLWSIDSSDNFTGERLYGPFTGWEVKAYHGNLDGTGRILWQRTADGLVSLWTVDDSDNFAGEKLYGPFTGWEVRSYDQNSLTSGRILWQRNSDDLVSLWTVDSSDNFAAEKLYGPFTDWTACSYD